MKIYLVQRTDPKGYDEYHNHVVLARSPGQARQLRAEIAGDEGAQIWQKDATTVTVIGYPAWTISGRKPHIILSDFNAG